VLVICDVATQLDCSTECVGKLSCSHAVFVICLYVVLYNLSHTSADINLNKTHLNLIPEKAKHGQTKRICIYSVS